MATLNMFKRSLVFLGIWRLALFGVAVVAPLLLAYQPSFPYATSLLPTYGLPQWLYSWANFDGVHYLTIAEKGYIGTGLVQAFFPTYPGLIGIFNWLFHNSIISGLVVSHLGLLVLLPLWWSLVKLDFGDNRASLSSIAWLLFPTAFFLGATYGESLFISLVLAAFLAARGRHWIVAGVLAAVAGATRVVGVLLVPALMFELLLQEAEISKVALSWRNFLTTMLTVLKRRKVELAWILLGVSGLVAYMIFLNDEYHDPLYFLHVQSEFGAGRQETIVLYPQVLWRYLKILVTYRPIDWKYFAFAQEAVAGGLGLLGLLWSAKSVRLSYVLFALGAFLVPTLTGTFSSMPRYILVCFPLFIWLAGILETRHWLKWLYLLVSSLLLILNTLLFIQGYWVA
jgi:Gpi18-like mannosyltransferase